jgi:hypothetical protein
MEALIKSLNESQKILDGLVKSAAEKEAALVAKLEAVSKKEAALKANGEAISLREAEVKKFGPVEEAYASLAKARAEASAELRKGMDMTESLAKKTADVDAKKAELDNIVEIYLKNNKNLSDAMAKLEEDRKGMKEKILEQLSKGLK